MTKESSRVATEGKTKTGNSVYRQIEEEVKQMKERLKAAGVNRIIAGVSDQMEEEEYESEDETNDATEAPNEKQKEEPAAA